ncbi:hypothetical protein CB0940_02110 [Cercospora beticola]|uniref:DUF7587 domain-containing protein n=2 Tax=Cercospora beticola TaxID=122368 RepID=A0A2G5IBJ5_CERBT|nr:hypothetical protein CB0940_02110 [Cercospora beticola]PIB02155.1 hypothetical protein CB0940_02110 [Cercospora beticola]
MTIADPAARRISTANRIEAEPQISYSHKHQPSENMVKRAASPTPWDKKFKAKVQRAARKAPPYLFEFGLLHDRTHSAVFSRGLVKPQAFDTGAVPDNIFEMPLQRIKDLNRVSFTRKPPDRVRSGLWSIWEPSLQSVVWQAISYCKENRHPSDEIFVAVLDTSCIRQGNIVLHENDFHLMQHGADVFEPRDDWYYVYGCLSDDDFALVTLNQICTPLPLSKLSGKYFERNHVSQVAPADIFNDEDFAGTDYFADEIILARAFGALFGQDFELPVACMAIASLCRHVDSHIKWLEDDCSLKSAVVAEFQDFDISEDLFKTVPKIKETKSSLLRVPDARRGMNLLIAVVKRKRQLLDSNREAGVLDIQTGLAQFAVGNGQPDYETDSDDASFQSSDTDPDISDDDASFNDSVHDHHAALPPGKMDDDTKRVLIEAQRRTPRYLFRAWHVNSGGSRGLNTTRGITPLAFSTNVVDASRTIYDMTKAELRENCDRQLTGYRIPPFRTQFSSWAADINTAFNFANSHMAHKYFIGIIDTTELSHANFIVHVPSLEPILGHRAYAHEYLAYGVITGPAYKAVSFQDFCNIGVGNTPILSEWRLYRSAQWARFRNDMTQQQIDDAKTVALRYGSKFAAAVMIAILCIEQRDGTFWRNGLKGHAVLLNNNMLDLPIPSQLCGDEGILTDIVYTTGFRGLEQMIRMLRAIVNLRHGKGARSRQLVAPWAS